MENDALVQEIRGSKTRGYTPYTGQHGDLELKLGVKTMSKMKYTVVFEEKRCILIGEQIAKNRSTPIAI
uniref:Uncharacterized protein n=1 Tax=Caenorhabditis japonica TaxID=281687 RepID=A0A8R1ESQ0_CAEJA